MFMEDFLSKRMKNRKLCVAKVQKTGFYKDDIGKLHQKEEHPLQIFEIPDKMISPKWGSLCHSEVILQDIINT